MHDPTAAGGPSNRPPRPRPSRRKSRHRGVGRPGPGPGGQRHRLHRRRPGRGLPGWAARPLRDVDGLQSFAISHLPIIILSANDAQMAALCDRLPMEPPVGGGLALFPAYAQGIHDCHAYWERHRESAHRRLPMVGIGLAGARRWINGLTGSLPMLR